MSSFFTLNVFVIVLLTPQILHCLPVQKSSSAESNQEKASYLYQRQRSLQRSANTGGRVTLDETDVVVQGEETKLREATEKKVRNARQTYFPPESASAEKMLEMMAEAAEAAEKEREMRERVRHSFAENLARAFAKQHPGAAATASTNAVSAATAAAAAAGVKPAPPGTKRDFSPSYGGR